MTNKKPTIAEQFNALLEKYPFTDEERAFIEGRIEKATRKSNGEKKLTAALVTTNVNSSSNFF